MLDLGVLGKVSHVLAEAYGPVVLKPKGSTWRSRKEEGGGALYDYAAHPVDLLTWYFGRPETVSGTYLGHVFSEDTEDEVFTTLDWGGGLSGQLSVSWSDESHRKMTTRVTVWGTNGKIYVDRQEIQVYLRDGVEAPEGYDTGWTVRYTTELSDEVDFYVRGEEYSAQLATFVKRVEEGAIRGAADFVEAAAADEVLYAIANNDRAGVRPVATGETTDTTPRRRSWRERRAARRAVRAELKG
nr:Gfo/Idh/MocA family oxidoreductase [Nocardioides sp. MAH-18]